MRKLSIQNLLQVALLCLCSGMLAAIPAHAQVTHTISTQVTSDAGSGDLVCEPSSVPDGGATVCTATPAQGWAFDVIAGIAGCSVQESIGNTCNLQNVIAPRSLSVSFMRPMGPATGLGASPLGTSLNVTWTSPAYTGHGPIINRAVSRIPLPVQIPPGGQIVNGCPANNCMLPNHHLDQAYWVVVYIDNAYGGPGNISSSSDHETFQVATLALPGGSQWATVRWYGGPWVAGDSLQWPQGGNTCVLSAKPEFTLPSTSDLEGEGAPAGASALVGVLALQASNCAPTGAGAALRTVIDFPSGSIPGGAYPWQYGSPAPGIAPIWFPGGSISGQTLTVTVPSDGTGTLAAKVALLDTPPPAGYTVSGTVSGLVGSVATPLVLRQRRQEPLGTAPLPAEATLTLAVNGSFVFDDPLVPHGGAYAISIDQQPSGHRCTVAHGSGEGVTSNATGVQIDCQVALPVRTAQPVPTLSEAALALLGALIGFVALRRRGGSTS